MGVWHLGISKNHNSLVGNAKGYKPESRIVFQQVSMALSCRFLRSNKLLEYRYSSCSTLKQGSILNTSIVLMHNSSKVEHNGSYTHLLTYHWHLQFILIYTLLFDWNIYQFHQARVRFPVSEVLARFLPKRISREPDSNQWPKDRNWLLQSSALPTELSRDPTLT